MVPPSFVIQMQTAGRPLAGKRNSAKSSYALDGNNGRPIRPRLRPERGSDGSSQVHSISAQTPALTSPGSLKPRLRSTTPVPSLYPVFDCQARRNYTSHAPTMSRGGVDRQVGTHPPPRRESQCAYLVDNPALWYTRDRHLAQEGNVRNVKKLDCCRNRCHNSIRCLRRPNSSDCNPHRGSSGYEYSSAGGYPDQCTGARADCNEYTGARADCNEYAGARADCNSDCRADASRTGLSALDLRDSKQCGFFSGGIG